MPRPEPAIELARQIHAGGCPYCQAQKPVDVHSAHYIWSIIVMTSYNTKTLIACRSCGASKQVGALFFCLFLGWWGFPFGLIITPIWIIRNLIGLAFPPNPSEPSAALIDVAANIYAEQVGLQALEEQDRRAPDPNKPWRS